MTSWGSFGNPIVGALGKLIRSAIQSANYVAGVAGWRISQDGQAEFADAVIRGELFVTGVDDSFISIEKTNGLDLFPYIRLMPANPSAYPNWISGFIFADPQTLNPTDQKLTLTLGSPSVNSTGDSAGIIFRSKGQVSGDEPRAEVTAALSRNMTGTLYPIPYTQHATELVTFAAAVTHTRVINFPTAFPAGVVPEVFTNINDSAGAVGFWKSTAYNITNTGFTLWVRTTDAARPAEAWTNVKVQWRAFAD